LARQVASFGHHALWKVVRTGSVHDKNAGAILPVCDNVYRGNLLIDSKIARCHHCGFGMRQSATARQPARQDSDFVPIKKQEQPKSALDL
jgi:hypothetical protein